LLSRVNRRERTIVQKSLRLPLKVVFYKEDGNWVAHCLEFDLIGDGETREEALDALSDAIDIQIHATIAHKNPANLFSPADGKFFQMFAAGKNVATGELHLIKAPPPRFDSFEIEGYEYREYAGGEMCAV
jgi:predicted RNase H-like HicB family nuclease